MAPFVRPYPTDTPTPHQEIALDLVFLVMDEERINRRYDEYMNIAARSPPPKVLLHLINERLHLLHRDHSHLLPKISRFRIGDQHIVYEPFPKSISAETLRLALIRSGMRQPRRKRRN